MHWRSWWCAVCLAVAPMPAHAQESNALRAPVDVELAPVVVTGARPGPGLWKVSKGGHVLWILGTVSPLPAGMQWRADEVRTVLAQADQVLDMPGVTVDANIGIFRGLLLLPSALKAMKNPDDKTLHEVLPADTWARWEVQKQRYFGRDDGIEKKRPLLAAQELYGRAVKQAGLDGKVVSSVVGEAMKRRKLDYTPTTLKLTIDDPKATIADFRKEQPGAQELACMNEMLDAVEHDLPRMVARANAWAIGDLDALRTLPLTERESCWSAWADTETMRKRGITDIKARLRANWVEIAGAALDKNATTFALLPVETLFRDDGVLADLAAKGYAVEAPQ